MPDCRFHLRDVTRLSDACELRESTRKPLREKARLRPGERLDEIRPLFGSARGAWRPRVVPTAEVASACASHCGAFQKIHFQTRIRSARSDVNGQGGRNSAQGRATADPAPTATRPDDRDMPRQLPRDRRGPTAGRWAPGVSLSAAAPRPTPGAGARPHEATRRNNL